MITSTLHGSCLFWGKDVAPHQQQWRVHRVLVPGVGVEELVCETPCLYCTFNAEGVFSTALARYVVYAIVVTALATA